MSKDVKVVEVEGKLAPEIENILKRLHDDGWEVVSSVGDRIILSREKKDGPQPLLEG